MWVKYNGVHFNDVDGSVIDDEEEEFDRDDDDFDDFHDDDADAEYYNLKETEFFENEERERERLIDEAIERAYGSNWTP